MASQDITLNTRPLSHYGATLLAGAYGSLLLPPQLKDFVENNDPLKDGTDVIVPGDEGEAHLDTATPKVMERDVTLTFFIRGATREEFLAYYEAFVAEMHKGWVTLHVPDLGKTFRLLYGNSTTYENYRLTACKVAVKFREPNPKNRK